MVPAIAAKPVPLLDASGAIKARIRAAKIDVGSVYGQTVADLAGGSTLGNRIPGAGQTFALAVLRLVESNFAGDARRERDGQVWMMPPTRIMPRPTCRCKLRRFKFNPISLTLYPLVRSAD